MNEKQPKKISRTGAVEWQGREEPRETAACLN